MTYASQVGSAFFRTSPRVPYSVRHLSIGLSTEFSKLEETRTSHFPTSHTSSAQGKRHGSHHCRRKNHGSERSWRSLLERRWNPCSLRCKRSRLKAKFKTSWSHVDRIERYFDHRNQNIAIKSSTQARCQRYNGCFAWATFKYPCQQIL